MFTSTDVKSAALRAALQSLILYFVFLISDLEKGGFGGWWRRLAEVLIGEEGHFAASGGALDEAFLYEIGFEDILDGPGIFAYGSGDGCQADRASVELIDDCAQNLIVDFVKSESVDIERFEGIAGNFGVDGAGTFDHGEVAYTAQQRVGDTRGPA